MSVPFRSYLLSKCHDRRRKKNQTRIDTTWKWLLSNCQKIKFLFEGIFPTFMFLTFLWKAIIVLLAFIYCLLHLFSSYTYYGDKDCKKRWYVILWKTPALHFSRDTEWTFCLQCIHYSTLSDVNQTYPTIHRTIHWPFLW